MFFQNEQPTLMLLKSLRPTQDTLKVNMISLTMTKKIVKSLVVVFSSIILDQTFLTTIYCLIFV